MFLHYMSNYKDSSVELLDEYRFYTNAMEKKRAKFQEADFHINETYFFY